MPFGICVIYCIYICIRIHMARNTIYLCSFLHMCYICLLQKYNSYHNRAASQLSSLCYHRVMRIIRIYQNLDLGQESVKNVLTYYDNSV